MARDLSDLKNLEKASKRKSHFWSVSKISLIIVFVIGLVIGAYIEFEVIEPMIRPTLYSKISLLEQQNKLLDSQISKFLSEQTLSTTQEPVEEPITDKNIVDENLETVQELQEVFVSINKTVYSFGETIETTISNQGNKKIFLGSCNPFFVEKVIEAEWKKVNEFQCVWESLPIILNSSESKSFNSNTVFWIENKGTFRINLQYSLDCTNGIPLSKADCKEEKQVFSEPFIIG